MHGKTNQRWFQMIRNPPNQRATTISVASILTRSHMPSAFLSGLLRKGNQTVCLPSWQSPDFDTQPQCVSFWLGGGTLFFVCFEGGGRKGTTTLLRDTTLLRGEGKEKNTLLRAFKTKKETTTTVPSSLLTPKTLGSHRLPWRRRDLWRPLAVNDAPRADVALEGGLVCLKKLLEGAIHAGFNILSQVAFIANPSGGLHKHEVPQQHAPLSVGGLMCMHRCKFYANKFTRQNCWDLQKKEHAKYRNGQLLLQAVWGHLRTAGLARNHVNVWAMEMMMMMVMVMMMMTMMNHHCVTCASLALYLRSPMFDLRGRSCNTLLDLIRPKQLGPCLTLTHTTDFLFWLR